MEDVAKVVNNDQNQIGVDEVVVGPGCETQIVSGLTEETQTSSGSQRSRKSTMLRQLHNKLGKLGKLGNV